MTSKIIPIILLQILMLPIFRTLAKLGLPPSSAPYRDYQDQSDSDSEEDDLLLSRP